MKFRRVINVVSLLVIVVGIAVLSSVPVSLMLDRNVDIALKLLVSGLIPVAAGLVMFAFSRGGEIFLGRREGFGVVTFGWLSVAAFGAIPFVLAGNLFWYDAFFETMSGFSTTGASVLDKSLVLTDGRMLENGIADLPKGLLYWRSLTHWFGGMGIVVLSLAIIPFLKLGGQQLYNAEVPGPTNDQLTPKIANSAKILWGVYVLLSAMETLLLLPSMSLFDAWCHTCGTMATGGFSTLQSSVGGFRSLYVEMVIMFFMFLAGCNFILHFRAQRGKPLLYFKDEEFRWYFFTLLVSTLLVSLMLLLRGGEIETSDGQLVSVGLLSALRYASFQVVSIMTTTGFCTANFATWPVFAAGLLVVLMFVGGCGGSTGGGMKVSRFILLVKYAWSQMQFCLFPHMVSNVRMNGKRIASDTLHKVVSFFFLFVMIYVIFALLLSIFPGVDLATAASASIAALGNIGPGLGAVGPSSTYAWLRPEAKLLLTLAMLVGRLEVYTVLVILLPSYWRK